MATLIKEIPEEDFIPIIEELERRPLDNNKYRVTTGEGRSQVFGFTRRSSYRPWISIHTWRRIELYKLLLEFATKNSITGWDGIQVNQNYRTSPHKDKGNQGESYIVGFGAYKGGDLLIYDSPIDIRHKLYSFNGSELLHSTSNFEGNRYSIVFFRIEYPEKFKIPSTEGRPILSVRAQILEEEIEVIKRGKAKKEQALLLEVTDAVDGSILVLNKKGKIVRTVRKGDETYKWKGYLTSLKSKV